MNYHTMLLKRMKKDVTSDRMNARAKESASISRYMKDYNWYASLLMYNSGVDGIVISSGNIVYSLTY